MPYVRRAGRSYDLATFVYDAKIKRVAELEWVSFAADLADMQSKLLRIEEQILQGLVIFPRSRTVSRRTKSKIYDAYQAPAPPKPKVVKKPEIPLPAARTRVPAPAQPASPRVVEKQPAPTPIRVKRPSPAESSLCLRYLRPHPRGRLHHNLESQSSRLRRLQRKTCSR